MIRWRNGINHHRKDNIPHGENNKNKIGPSVFWTASSTLGSTDNWCNWQAFHFLTPWHLWTAFNDRSADGKRHSSKAEKHLDDYPRTWNG